MSGEVTEIVESKRAQSSGTKAGWIAKFVVCALYDLFDMTIGRIMFATPFLGEAIGIALCCALFGKAGMLYGLEAVDFTEQIDGFVPTASIIAWVNRVR